MGSATETERRSYVRISYPPQAQALMTVRADRLDVADISQCGLRVTRPSGGPSEPCVTATLKLLCGASVEIEADLEWEEEREVGYSLTKLIPAELIERELRYVTLHFE